MMTESLPIKKSRTVWWIAIIFASWAIGATCWAVVLQQQLRIQAVEFHARQYEFRQKMVQPLVPVIEEHYEPVKNGARPPLTVFNAWIPMARVTTLPSGNVQYQWHTRNAAMDGPTFYVVESDPCQRVTKIDTFTPEF